MQRLRYLALAGRLVLSQRNAGNTGDGTVFTFSATSAYLVTLEAGV